MAGPFFVAKCPACYRSISICVNGKLEGGYSGDPLVCGHCAHLSIIQENGEARDLVKAQVKWIEDRPEILKQVWAEQRAVINAERLGEGIETSAWPFPQKSGDAAKQGVSE